jgi:hypothetical protein
VVNEFIGLLLLAVPFGIAVATIVIGLAHREKKPTALLGVVSPKKPQDARRAPKTTRKVN